MFLCSKKLAGQITELDILHRKLFYQPYLFAESANGPIALQLN